MPSATARPCNDHGPLSGPGRGGADSAMTTRRASTRVRKAVLLLGLGACAACTQGPDYERPVVEVPGAYRFDAAALTAEALPAGPAWWDGFGDPVLDRMIRECLANNRYLRIAAARVDEFAAVLVGSRAQGPRPSRTAAFRTRVDARLVVIAPSAPRRPGPDSGP